MSGKCTKVIYKLCTDDDGHLSKYNNRWYLEQGIGLDWEIYTNSFKNLYQITTVTKLRDFQYRFLLMKIPTNVQLFYWKRSVSIKCDFCKLETELIEHLFVKCTYVNRIWEFISNLIDPQWVPNIKTIIINNKHEKASNIHNFIILIVKQYIYRCKWLKQKPNINGITNEIKMYYAIELYNAKKRAKEKNMLKGGVR